MANELGAGYCTVVVLSAWYCTVVVVSGSSGGCFTSSTRDIPCTLQDCIDAFTQEEQLEGDEKFFCPHCKVPNIELI